MDKIKILELFGGIGACSKALERLGIDYEIADYVEIDKYAVKSFNAMHGTNFEPQDICKWDKDIKVDLIMHGSPCQDFSVAGLQAGGDEGSGTRSSLMYETIRIVKKLKPKYIIWENVKNLLSKKHRHNFDSYLETMEELGYKNYYRVLNAKDYGIPQNRERVFTISIRNDIDTDYVFPTKQELKLKLKDMLEDEVDEKYYISNKMIDYICAMMPLGWHHITTGIHIENKDSENVAGTICTEPGNKPSDNYIIDNDNIEYSKELGYLKEKNAQEYKEYSNFYVIPRASDGKLINGSYNRVWKEEKQVGTINLTKVQEIGKKDEFNNLRIRKLTPKECWRLMGFEDEDFEKANQVCSNSQLYKQAGNSIVVNVLEAILNNLLFKNEIDRKPITKGIYTRLRQI